ncbi:MAG: hypothetical protein NT099_03325 [Candidatus Saganbacteria bacterium]|nr:hypothetical protein [Candidatus Saganbacteria bacterium]
MDPLSGITTYDINYLSKMGGTQGVSKKEDVANEFVSIFVDEILKESFSEGIDGQSNPNLSAVKELLREKLTEELMKSDTFALKDALARLGNQK